MSTDTKTKAPRGIDAAIAMPIVARIEENAGLRPDTVEFEEWQEASEATGHDFIIAASVRFLRDQGGTAWWAIGKALGLPGAGDSAATGKAGAAFARKMYAKGFGSTPRTQKERKPVSEWKKEKNEARIELKAIPKSERIAIVKAGKPALDMALPDQTIVEMLMGRSIAWYINLATLCDSPDDFYEQTADIHRRMIYITGEGEDRTLHFKEVDRSGPIPLREVGGVTRSVRLRAIHSVK
jgi:hypothetical protein